MRYRYSTNRSAGRIILTGIFVVYCVIYLLTIFSIPHPHNQQLIGSTIVTMLWTVVLFGAMWFGHNWARYIYLCILLLTIVLSIPMIFGVQAMDVPLPVSLWVLMAFHIGVFFMLIYSPAIRALTKR